MIRAHPTSSISGWGSSVRPVPNTGTVRELDIQVPADLQTPTLTKESTLNAVDRLQIKPLHEFANGGPTLLTEMLGRAGFASPPATISRAVSIEEIMRQPPAVILTPDPDGRDAALRRRVLARAGLLVAEAAFPRALINCGGPTIVPAMQRLAAIREGMRR